MIFFKFSFFLIFILPYSWAQSELKDSLDPSTALKIRKHFPGYRVHYDPVEIAQEVQKKLDEEKDKEIKEQNEDKKMFKFIKR